MAMYLRRLGHNRTLVSTTYRPTTTRSWSRSFAASSKEDDDAEPKPSQLQVQAQEMLDICSRGIGQVIFLNSPTSGAVILGGLAVSSPYLAGLGALGAVTATGTAKLAGMDNGMLKDGLWTYNGCLVGCAAAVFGPASVMACTTSTIVGAAATPFVSATLKEIMVMPQWTYSFNAVALTSLLRTRPLLPAPAETVADVIEIEPVANSVGMGDLLAAPFTGISQIFVVESPLSGGIIWYGIGMYSPGLAGHALMGSTIGMVSGALMGADASELAMGLWGYNSALTSMAVGVFFVHSTPAVALSAFGAAATASVFGAMKTIGGIYGAPALTLPFCTTVSACYLLGKQLKGLEFASSPHSPEKNKA